MSPGPLTPEEILDAAAEVLRRFGPRKATVVDVARELGVSHGTVYRHFDSKAALRDAVAERWLHRISQPLAEIAAGDGPAEDRLRRWLATLVELKRAKVTDDENMFAAYSALAMESRAVVDAHVAELASHLGRIVADGVAAGDFHADDASATGRSVLSATSRFHHPLHRQEWDEPGIDDDFARVVDLVVAGLRSG